MGHIRQHGPKRLTLIWFWHNHRATLQYDWLAAWHCLYDPDALPLHVAWPMLEEILKNRSSHCFATLAEWTWIPDAADRILYAFSHKPTGPARNPEWQQTANGMRHTMNPRPHDMKARRELNKRLGID